MNRSLTRWLLVTGIAVTATVSLLTAAPQTVDIVVKDRTSAYGSLAAAGSFAAVAWTSASIRLVSSPRG